VRGERVVWVAWVAHKQQRRPYFFRGISTPKGTIIYAEKAIEPAVDGFRLLSRGFLNDDVGR
jgi:hypothetical protein